MQESSSILKGLKSLQKKKQTRDKGGVYNIEFLVKNLFPYP